MEFFLYAGLAWIVVVVLALFFRTTKPVAKDDSAKAPYKIEPPTLEEVAEEPEVKATPKKRVYKKKVKENLDV